MGENLSWKKSSGRTSKSRTRILEEKKKEKEETTAEPSRKGDVEDAG